MKKCKTFVHFAITYAPIAPDERICNSILHKKEKALDIFAKRLYNNIKGCTR